MRLVDSNRLDASVICFFVLFNAQKLVHSCAAVNFFRCMCYCSCYVHPLALSKYVFAGSYLKKKGQ